jgi:hypothetical protein
MANSSLNNEFRILDKFHLWLKKTKPYMPHWEKLESRYKIVSKLQYVSIFAHINFGYAQQCKQ